MSQSFSTAHGSPRDRGSADRYYGRSFDPHYYPYGTGKGVPMGGRVHQVFMTEQQIAEYKDGWDNEEDRKD